MLHRAKRLVAASLAATLILAATLAAPATAITDGYPDAEGHPYVGLMVAQDGSGNPMWRCSGTLLTPTVFLTAGHCTDGAAHVEIWFQSDVQSGTPGNGYPYTGQAGGTPYTHPDYPNGPFFHADLGVVVLDAPYVTSAYGAIPSLDQLDALKPGRRTTFTAVGYGLQTSFPDAASFLEHNVKVRMVAHPHLLQINVPGFTGDYSLLLSNNANTGGTCFGDSGGPNFLGTSNVVAAVTSFGINGNCAGTGGVYRIDREDDLDWLADFLD